MATNGEATAVKVALISMVSAIIVALIANADKFGRAAPPPPAAVVTVAPPVEATAAAAEPTPMPVEAPIASAPPRIKPPPVTRDLPAVTPPRIEPVAPPALALGDRRLIAAWGRSNDGVVRRFIMRNDTSQPLVRLFVSAPGEAAEGPDRLGGVAVPPGVSISVDADDGTKRCAFDMRAVFADGRELGQSSFDVCSGLNYMWQLPGDRR